MKIRAEKTRGDDVELLGMGKNQIRELVDQWIKLMCCAAQLRRATRESVDSE